MQAWLTGLNPELGDRVPLRLLRESDIYAVAPAILSAARAILAEDRRMELKSACQTNRPQMSMGKEITFGCPNSFVAAANAF